MTAERDGLAEIVGVLAEHDGIQQSRREGTKPGFTEWRAHCTCGADMPWATGDRAAAYSAHLADALADLLAARDRRVRAEALREAAIATLSMTYPTSADPDVWGAWLHDRADQIEADA